MLCLGTRIMKTVAVWIYLACQWSVSWVICFLFFIRIFDKSLLNLIPTHSNIILPTRVQGFKAHWSINYFWTFLLLFLIALETWVALWQCSLSIIKNYHQIMVLPNIFFWRCIHQSPLWMYKYGLTSYVSYFCDSCEELCTC